MEAGEAVQHQVVDAAERPIGSRGHTKRRAGHVGKRVLPDPVHVYKIAAVIRGEVGAQSVGSGPGEVARNDQETSDPEAALLWTPKLAQARRGGVHTEARLAFCRPISRLVTVKQYDHLSGSRRQQRRVGITIHSKRQASNAAGGQIGHLSVEAQLAPPGSAEEI